MSSATHPSPSSSPAPNTSSPSRRIRPVHHPQPHATPPCPNLRTSALPPHDISPLPHTPPPVLPSSQKNTHSTRQTHMNTHTQSASPINRGGCCAPNPGHRPLRPSPPRQQPKPIHWQALFSYKSATAVAVLAEKLATNTFAAATSSLPVQIQQHPGTCSPFFSYKSATAVAVFAVKLATNLFAAAMNSLQVQIQNHPPLAVPSCTPHPPVGQTIPLPRYIIIPTPRPPSPMHPHSQPAKISPVPEI